MMFLFNKLSYSNVGLNPYFNKGSSFSFFTEREKNNEINKLPINFINDKFSYFLPSVNTNHGVGRINNFPKGSFPEILQNIKGANLIKIFDKLRKASDIENTKINSNIVIIY